MNDLAGGVPDRAVITVAGKARELSVSEFTALDLHAQVNHLFKGEVTFFLGRDKLRTVDALKALRTQRVQATQATSAPALR
jgi:hypothetical protein